MSRGHDAAPDLDRDITSKNRRRALKRLLEFLIYILIAIVLVGVIIFYASKHRSEPAPDLRWVGLAVITLITFGYPLKWLRACWRRRRFWGVFLLLLMIHLAAYIEVLRNVEHFGYLWFAIANSIEWLVIVPILQRAGEQPPKK